MRVDLEQEGQKAFDIEFNGKPLSDVIWADDETGECLIFERHHQSGELVQDPGGEYYGYRTLTIKGNVKIIDRRPKQESSGQSVYDFQYPGMCFLRVSAAQFSGDSSTISVLNAPDRQTVHTFFFEAATAADLVDKVLVIFERANVQVVEVDGRGTGGYVYSLLACNLNCRVYLV